MNNILEKEEISKYTIVEDTVLYLDNLEEVNIDINNNCKVDVYHFLIDNNCKIKINLNSEGASINYYFSNINYNDHNIVVDIKHNNKKTTSNIYNHGVNVFNNRLHFLINGIILRDMFDSICNQENQIINISDGKSTICPNLLIDCYDVNSSHSAYIGKFNLDKLFYMESRGLSRDVAYQLLMKGFLIPDFVEKEKIEKILVEISKI